MPSAWSSWGIPDQALQASPAFREYLDLAADAGWGSLVSGEKLTVGKGDALLVIDMQNDFVPKNDKDNPRGGAFAVTEGDLIAGVVVKLMEEFAARDGLVVVTRDYHPDDHCSFHTNKGNFPPHCIAGSVGSHFYEPIEKCVRELHRLKKRIEVVFKGFHEDIDSFGAMEYPDDVHAKNRQIKRAEPGPDSEERCHGCSIYSWTGSQRLKCSNLKEDANAPPDIMSIFKGRRLSLNDLLRNGLDGTQPVERIFVCGLAMDYCVMDTCINAAKAGFSNVNLVLDAARAAYVPGMGTHGSGFLQDPKELHGWMEANKVKLIASTTMLAAPTGARTFQFEKGRLFPDQIGPFQLVPCEGIDLRLESGAYAGSGSNEEGKEVIKELEAQGLKAEGNHLPISSITLPDEERKQAGIPPEATRFCWANPANCKDADSQFLAYFAIKNACAAFFVFGGFVYLDNNNKIWGIKALSQKAETGGTGLRFEAPKDLPGSAVAALESRWSPTNSPCLKSKGAMRFAWINPSEKFPEHPDVSDWTHGAFAYEVATGDGDNRGKCIKFFPVDGRQEDGTAAREAGGGTRKEVAPTPARAAPPPVPHEQGKTTPLDTIGSCIQELQRIKEQIEAAIPNTLINKPASNGVAP